VISFGEKRCAWKGNRMSLGVLEEGECQAHPERTAVGPRGLVVAVAGSVGQEQERPG
jgi:hypothetical protein